MKMQDSENTYLICLFLKLCKIRRIIISLIVLMCIVMTVRLINIRTSMLSGSLDPILGENNGPHAQRRDRDQPGYFMKGTNPLENGTFCRFKYGLPNKLNWNQLVSYGSPQLGKKSPYRVIYDAIERTMFDESYTLDQVTYATHVTPEFLYHIVEIARYWDGPISVAAFVPDYDLDLTMKLFAHLCKCYDGMSKVSVHLVYPEQDLPRFLNEEPRMYKKHRNLTREDTNRVDVKKRSLNDDEAEERKEMALKENATMEIINKFNRDVMDITKKNVTKSPTKFNSKIFLALQKKKRESILNIIFKDCSIPDMSETRTFRSRHGLIYPVNVARNVARNASSTQYILVSDVEMIPSDGLATKFTIMIKRHRINGQYGVIPKWRLAFVIPVFEVEAGEDVPRNKSSLQQLYAEGKAVYFHRWVCSHCQRIPDLQAWLKDDPGNIIKPFAITKRQYPYHRWEPIFIATRHTPWYSETLSWEGRQDKMTQMLEMCLKSYDFVVMNGAFLCHSPGIKSKSKRRSWRYRHELVNSKQYDLIVKNLAERYPANPKCRLE